MHAARAMAAKVAATLGGQINPCVYGSRLCNAAQAHLWSRERRAACEQPKVHGERWGRLCFMHAASA